MGRAAAAAAAGVRVDEPAALRAARGVGVFIVAPCLGRSECGAAGFHSLMLRRGMYTYTYVPHLLMTGVAENEVNFQPRVSSKRNQCT